MYGHPEFDGESIKQVIPSVESIGDCIYGGQKIVYGVTIEGTRYALKIIPYRAESSEGEECPQNTVMPSDMLPRTFREVRILESCNIPQLPKLGPLKLTNCQIRGQNAVYYTEEWIDGENLKSIIQRQTLGIIEIAMLGMDLSRAIEELWKHGIIHRDIKPQNIIKKSSMSGYTLLDPGMAYDLHDASLTQAGGVPGTFPYYSPEQIDVSRKRMMDFRSDFFNVGIVLYEAAIGTHPFLVKNGHRIDRDETLLKLLTGSPVPPSSLRNDVPKKLDDTIMRLLAKKPHLRHNSFDRLNSDLKEIINENGGEV